MKTENIISRDPTTEERNIISSHGTFKCFKSHYILSILNLISTSWSPIFTIWVILFLSKCEVDGFIDLVLVLFLCVLLLFIDYIFVSEFIELFISREKKNLRVALKKKTYGVVDADVIDYVRDYDSQDNLVFDLDGDKFSVIVEGKFHLGESHVILLCFSVKKYFKGKEVKEYVALTY